MITDITNFYALFSSEIDGDRLDFVFSHPELDPIRKFRRSDTIPLGIVITTPEYGLDEIGLLEGDIGFLNVQHIMPNGEILFEPQTFIEACSQNDLLNEGDILIARTGHTLGKAAMITSELSGYSFGSFCIRFTVLPESCFQNEFVVYFLNSSYGQSQILMLKTGSGKYNINRNQIKDIRLPRIDIDRQNEIIVAVKSIESEAVSLRNQAQAIRQAAEEFMLNQLGITISPDTNYFFKTGKEQQPCSFVIFPDNAIDRLHYLFFHPRQRMLDALRSLYCTLPLEKICREPIIRGEQPEYDEFGTITVLKTVDLKNGYIDYDHTLRISQEYFDAHPSAHVQREDILVASTGYVSMGKIDVYDRNEPATVDGHIAIIRVNKNDYDPYFIAYFLRSHLGQQQFEKWFTGSSGQIELQPSDLGRILILASTSRGIPLDRQQKIAAAMTTRLNETRVLEQRASIKWREGRQTFDDMVFER